MREAIKIVLPYARTIDCSPNYDEHEPATNEAERVHLITEAAPFVYALVHEKHVGQISNKLAQIPDIVFYVAASTAGHVDYRGIQINHRNADKFHGVAALRAITGIPKEYTLAIGDGDNDLSLFENAGLKIARL